MNFKMAYAIQCHKNYDQINKLINSLDDENIDFFIHIDKKSNIYNKIIRKFNVYILEDRVDVSWGKISQVEATLKLLKKINCTKKYNYIHLISGQDFPIKNKETIKSFFIKNEGLEFIECEKIPISKWSYGGVNRITLYYPNFFFINSFTKKLMWYYEKLAMKISFLHKKPIYGIESFYGGSSWFSLTGNCIEYILKYIDDNPKYLAYFKKSLCSDEVFFQTIVMNSQFKYKCNNNNNRYIVWNEGDCSPRIFNKDDYREMKKSDKLFGRKFDMNIDNKIIDMLIEYNTVLEKYNEQ